MIDKTNFSLLHHNTFGMDVKTKRYVECESVDELRATLKQLSDLPLPLLTIGGGSNLLFADDYPGVILKAAIRTIEIVNETSEFVDVRCGAGVVWDDFVAYAVRNGWYGVENLSYIPGEVGASAIQNIGAYGVEVKDVIRLVETIEIATLTGRTFTNRDCCYAYRQSIFKKELRGKYVVTHVTYRLSKLPHFTLHYGNVKEELEKNGKTISLENVREVIVAIRKAKLPDPVELGNAGSFFMNPVVPIEKYQQLRELYPQMPHYPVDECSVKIPAGWLIEQAGWKGKTMGRAGVHHRQALVLVNLGGATGDEIMCLARAIVNSIHEQFGITIHPEVNFVKEGEIE